MVVQTGSFATAASLLHLTPSAVSLQMKQLETWFGQVLFDRSGRGTRPTPFARSVVADSQEFLRHIESLRGRRPIAVSGTLRVGVIPNVEKTAFPRALRLLRERYPDLKIRPAGRGTSVDMVDGVKGGKIDAAVVVQPIHKASMRLDWVELGREPFVMIAPRDATEDTPRQLLLQYPWIRYDTSLTGGRMASEFVRKIVPDCPYAFELTTTDAVLAMVSEGLGVSVVPRPRTPLLLAYPVRVIELGPKAPIRTVALVTRKADSDDRRVRALAEVLMEMFMPPGPVHATGATTPVT